MILIIGGAYQGKLEFARMNFSLTDQDIFTCTDTEIDFSKQCINGLENFTYACLRASIDPIEYFKKNSDSWKQSILICRDISSGVVPMSSDMRLWRQLNGRLCQYLSQHALKVSRIFCGLEQRLK